MDRKPSRPKPCAKIMHKTIGRSTQPNIVSKTCTLQTPCESLATQLAQRRGGFAPLLTSWLTTWASNGKNITQPNILPLVVFFPQGATRKLSHLSSLVTSIVSLHQENFLELANFFNASAIFFKVSTFTSNTFLSSIISLTK